MELLGMFVEVVLAREHLGASTAIELAPIRIARTCSGPVTGFLLPHMQAAAFRLLRRTRVDR